MQDTRSSNSSVSPSGVTTFDRVPEYIGLRCMRVWMGLIGYWEAPNILTDYWDLRNILADYW